MYGHRYFGERYFGPRYWGPSGSALLVYHECRKALEARLATATGLSTLTVAWPNRPVTVPQSASWLRVHAVRYRRGEAVLFGGTTAKGMHFGEFQVDVLGRASTGYGPLNDIADAIRDRFNRQELTVPSGMQLICLAPSGPVVEEERGFARVSVRIPFMVSETVPN